MIEREVCGLAKISGVFQFLDGVNFAWFCIPYVDEYKLGCNFFLIFLFLGLTMRIRSEYHV